MAMEKLDQPKYKILMFPWLAHGHIHPFLELSKKLSNRNLNIYLCSTLINLDSIKPSISQKESSLIKLVELHIPSSSPQLPPNLHTTKNLPSNLIPTLIQAFQNSKSSFSEILNTVNPDLLIYDVFQPWAAKLASSKGIASVYFGTSGATPFSYYHHLYTYGNASTFPYKSIYMSDHDMSSIRARILPLIKEADDDFAFGNFTLSSDIVLMKSCRAVEEKYIDYLSVLSKKRIVPTGPLLASESNDENEESLEIMNWLSGKNKASTVYISFGSEYFLSKDQITEMAKGLQLCDANFLWVIRYSAEETKTRCIEEELPKGFSETVKERGKIVRGWAPQAKILAHSSVGGFVSHCGWSSITESMYFGVPVVAMPMKSDQPLNARMIVELGVSVEVEKGDDGRCVGEEIAKAINKVIECGDMTNTSKELSVKIKENEKQEMGEVAEELLRICVKNKEQVGLKNMAF